MSDPETNKLASPDRTTVRIRAALGVLVLGALLIGVSQRLAAVASPPLYDGVVVADPYRYLTPLPNQAGSPTSAKVSQPVVNGSSPAIAASTSESPPQAQLVASPDLFAVTPATTALTLTIDPVQPQTPLPSTPIAGNAYRFAVTDQTGAAVSLRQGPKGVGRAPCSERHPRCHDHPRHGRRLAVCPDRGGRPARDLPVQHRRPRRLRPGLEAGIRVRSPSCGRGLAGGGGPGHRGVRGGRTAYPASTHSGSLTAEIKTAEQAAPPSMTGTNVPLGSHTIRRPSMSSIASVTSIFSARWRRRITVAIASALVVAGCAIPANRPSTTPSGSPIRIGAVFPIDGNASGLAKQELAGVQIAADFANADGGVNGRRIVLDVRDLESRADAPSVMANLKADGVSAVVGAYSSDLSIAASAAADSEGLVYWEAGAVADRLTGRGLPLVFRVGASGTNLGANSAAFAASELAPRLHTTPSGVRLAIVAADDDYARSVADAAAAGATQAGIPIVSQTNYSLTLPDWPGIMAKLAAAHPSVIILASHIPDGVAFRKAMLTAGLKVQALIGSTMAECDPDFAGDLGPDAVGIFASDRPTGGFQPGALDPSARATYDRFAAAWATAYPPVSTDHGYDAAPSAGGDSEYTISGPVEAGTAEAGPSEEGLSGFSAAWALFHDVLPSAAAAGPLDASTIAAAARDVDLPTGSLPDGAGLAFSSDPATLGQNLRAAAVIWQWQAVRSYTFVWPPTYATGTIGFVPLTR